MTPVVSGEPNNMSTDDKERAKDPDQGKSANESVAVKAFVDRIESDFAVTLLGEGGDQIDVPIQYMPSGIKAGDHLVIIFQLDPESREATLKNISELKRELTKNNDPQQTEFKL